MRLHAATLTAVATAATIALAGCTSDADEATPDQTAGAHYPVTIQSSIGSTSIPAKPTRIATIGEVDTYTIASLGITPVAHSIPDITYSPWLAGKIDPAASVVSGEEINMEKLAAAAPDVIIAGGGWVTPEERARYDAIAPTIGSSLTSLGADSNATEPWRDRLRILGQILDEEAKAEHVITETEDYLKTEGAKVPEIGTKTFRFLAYAMFDGSNFVNGNASIFEALGFTSTDANAQRATVSEENMQQIDADYLFIWTNADGRARLEADPRFAKLKAVTGGHLVWLSDPMAFASNNPSPLSIRYFVDELMAGLRA